MHHVLVHEPVSHWTAELQRGLREVGEMTVRWVPHLVDVREACSQGRVDLLVVVDSNIDSDRAPLFWECLKAAPHKLKTMLLTADESPAWEWTARELGFDVVLPETSEKRRVVHAVRRLLRTPAIANDGF